MREIKFRVLKNGKWIYFGLPNGVIWTNVGYDWSTLSQFTGLVDKSGKEIFEGDIVQGVKDHEGHSEVFYGYGQWQPFSFLGSHNGEDYKVIANVYEDSDLKI